jgi:hypothetical protein
MQAIAALVLLIDSFAIGVVNGHESAVDVAFGKAFELPTEESCARVTTPILVDDVPAEIRGFARVVDEVSISVPVGCDLNPIIRRPDIEASRPDDVIGYQFQQMRAIDSVKDVKIDGTARHSTGASSSIDHAELDSQWLIIGQPSLIHFENPDGMHDQERTVRGEKLLTAEHNLLASKFGLRAGGEGDEDSGHREGECSARRPIQTGIKDTSAEQSETGRDNPILVGAGFVALLVFLLLVAIASTDWINGAWDKPRTYVDNGESDDGQRYGNERTPQHRHRFLGWLAPSRITKRRGG